MGKWSTILGIGKKVANHSATQTTARSIGAVSYTHLDVYKRQVDDIRVEPSGQEGTYKMTAIIDGERVSHEITPVSYTHL